MRHSISRTFAITLIAAFLGGLIGTLCSPTATAASLQDSLTTLQNIGKEAAGHDRAMVAWKIVAAAPAQQLPTILAAMDDESLLVDNWLRAAVDSIAERTLKSGESLPQAALEAYLGDHNRSSRSRRLAFEWLVKIDPSTTDRWIARFLDDPCLELRREAVARQLEAAATAAEADQNGTAVAAYEKALKHARDIDQIKAAFGALVNLDQEVDLPAQLGFITRWRLIGPFDNTDGKGFDREFPPEASIDFGQEYPGKDLVVQWQTGETEDDYGNVDLNQLLGKHKGSAAYALAYFHADEATPVELRLGCINASKIWLNEELIATNEVYHAATSIDQYVGRGTLKPGRNTILLKICQNEQTDSWAQDWKFQLRVCDALGTAILPADASH